MEQINVPKLGHVPKTPVIIIGVGGALYIGWRWYTASQMPADDTTAADDGFSDPGALPTVPGAYDDAVGIPDDTGGDTSSYGFTGTTNSQWTQYAATQLSMDGDTSYVTVLTDLGYFLAGKALTADQVSIVQAAIAVAGYPPEGNHPIVSGGDSTITVAPTGLSGAATNSTTVHLSWGAVPGADGYRIYRSGDEAPASEAFGTSGTVGGLQPGTAYTFQVAAHTSSGNIGPKSNAVSITTARPKMKTPGRPSVSNVGATGLRVLWGTSEAQATGYHVYENGHDVGQTQGTFMTRSGLKPNTRYTYQIQAIGPGNALSAKSASVATKTKAK
ncbi:Fibronectin type III domain-containing protein [Streptomyces sp. DvalAA-14]|uniref:fibronectin type III domain-containing protein n=1 Tax=unclassified Streptomyces TaxID=2593676 RepID=UPI00081B2B70|nr:MULTISPECIES: fibronectin type III domain-containing protein [unclassified Streptomyces]MYS19161.1 hypothetical protein [Streptomyces sp. SID4948]SCD38103.1 Fibronectin type III domain-containing protein [Streptomyces sp. DvalAA-14]